MVPSANVKYHVAVDAASETNGGQIGGTVTTGKVIDTLGYNQCTICVIASTAATNKNPSTFRVLECDNTTLTNFSTVAALVGGTATSATVGFIIPTSEGTQSDSTYKPYAVFNIDCRKYKRYLQVDIVPTTTQTYSAVAILSRGGVAPDSAAEQNARGVINA